MPVSRPYATNNLNQYTSAGSGNSAVTFTYDHRGNLTASGSIGYTYNSRNQLITGPGVNLMYRNPLGLTNQLIRTNGPTSGFDYVSGNLATELENNAVARRYVYGPGTDEPIVWYEGSGTSDRRYLHVDERGTIVAVSDGSGNAIAINRYDEYGIPASTNLGRFQYTGQKWFSELGLYDYKARMYSPTLGRFLQPDPIGYGDGLNIYGYTGGDPINRADPSGTDANSDFNNVPRVDIIPGDVVVTGVRIPNLFITNGFLNVGLGANFNELGNMSGISVALNINITVSVEGVLTATNNLFLPTRKGHYGRNVNNHPPQTRAQAEQAQWRRVTDESKNAYHRFGPNGEGNVKYLSPDGRQEAVYDKKGKLVTDVQNAGTYNYSPGFGVGHFIDDVIPYWFFGNAPNDPTPFLQRVGGR